MNSFVTCLSHVVHSVGLVSPLICMTDTLTCKRRKYNLTSLDTARFRPYRI